jgi:hypothetical protein
MVYHVGGLTSLVQSPASLTLPKDFAEAVQIREEDDIVYFINKEIQEKLPEYIFGVVGRIELYNKGDFTKEEMMESGDAFKSKTKPRQGSLVGALAG